MPGARRLSLSSSTRMVARTLVTGSGAAGDFFKIVSGNSQQNTWKMGEYDQSFPPTFRIQIVEVLPPRLAAWRRCE